MLQLLKEAAPNATRVGKNGGPPFCPQSEASVRALGLQLITFPLSDSISRRPRLPTALSGCSPAEISRRAQIAGFPA
jgi:hypothetical protein